MLFWFHVLISGGVFSHLLPTPSLGMSLLLAFSPLPPPPPPSYMANYFWCFFILFKPPTPSPVSWPTSVIGNKTAGQVFSIPLQNAFKMPGIYDLPGNVILWNTIVAPLCVWMFLPCFNYFLPLVEGQCLKKQRRGRWWTSGNSAWWNTCQ